MRKLTGYIGAMIIVFALMGSVLLGFALNINGQSTVINDYEKITDVSGLYTHSEEKTYLEYNPASNYTGYSSEKIGYSNTPTNPNTAGMGYLTMKRITADCNIGFSNSKMISINSADIGVFSTGGIYWRDVFFSKCLRVSGNETDNYYYLTYTDGTWHELTVSNVSLIINNGNITASGLTTSNNPFSLTTSYDYGMIYWAGDDYDYYNNRTLGQYTGTVPAYFTTDGAPIYTYGIINGSFSTTNNDNVYNWDNGGETSLWMFTTTTVSGTIKHTDNANYSGSYHIFYPRNIIIPSLGIDYTESNRVNNYPIPNSAYSIDSTSTQTINLSNLTGITNYFPVANDKTVTFYKTNQSGIWNNGSNNIDVFDGTYFMPARTVNGVELGYLNYKLSDILTAGATIPANTKQIKIDLNTNNSIAYNRNLNVTNYIDYIDSNLPCLNNGVFVNNDAYPSAMGNYTIITNNGFGTKDYAIYDIDNNIVNVYSYDGVKKATMTPDQCYIVTTNLSGYNGASPLDTYSAEKRKLSNGNGAVSNYVMSFYYNQSPSANYGYTNSNNYTTNVFLTYYISDVHDIKYFDITKGYSIKSDNVTSTIWDNAFENGKIQLLFRANDLNGTYQNTITVSGNDINIDYTNNRYYITLGADTVDIGTWRNIVLNIDLINGKLSAIPVRTFNSFTNVVLDNSVVNIGDLIGATPTNSIIWAPTNKSLMFNVYSTDVFLNTYGVVMVNPSLTITDYFPDLGQFYRLKLDKFATYGDTITINGTTYPVSNGTITIGDDVLTLKNVYIEYANGDVTVKDDHVEINTGAIVSDTVSMTGTWYFLTDLERGYTTQKMIYDWDWGTFILDNTAFVVIYVGLLGVSLVVARRFCNLSITDYALMIVSVIIALSVQVIA